MFSIGVWKNKVVERARRKLTRMNTTEHNNGNRKMFFQEKMGSFTLPFGEDPPPAVIGYERNLLPIK
jgi:hypothetical protein